MSGSGDSSPRLPCLSFSPKAAIINNTPIDDTLHCIMVISNPCQYKRRYKLAEQFKWRMAAEPNVKLYVVELSYDSVFHVTNPNNPRHLQIDTRTPPLWVKENLINIGVRQLLPKSWKAFAWIDADIEFESAHWADDTLKILNGSSDVVQLFSHCIDMNAAQEPMNTFTSFAYQHCHTGRKQFWHPGFAWAMTRKAYDRIGSVFEYNILGAGDNTFAKSLLGFGPSSLKPKNSKGFKEAVKEYQERVRTLRLGYVPGIIRHFYHGSKKNRGYMDRWKILIKHQYDPRKHIVKLSNGLIAPSENCPQELLDDIRKYFESRKEDDV